MHEHQTPGGRASSWIDLLDPLRRHESLPRRVFGRLRRRGEEEEQEAEAVEFERLENCQVAPPREEHLDGLIQADKLSFTQKEKYLDKLLQAGLHDLDRVDKIEYTQFCPAAEGEEPIAVWQLTIQPWLRKPVALEASEAITG